MVSDTKVYKTYVHSGLPTIYKATVSNRLALRVAVAMDELETRCVYIVKAVHKVRTYLNLDVTWKITEATWGNPPAIPYLKLDGGRVSASPASGIFYTRTSYGVDTASTSKMGLASLFIHTAFRVRCRTNDANELRQGW